MFMVRRHEQSGFASSAYVFPGGSVIASDLTSGAQSLSSSLTAAEAAAILGRRGDVTPEDSVECLGYWLAGARELLEEGGVLIHDQTRPVSQQALGQARAATLERGDQFAEAVRALDAQLDLASLIYFSHWRTPVQSPKRYDTRFFLAVMPEDQEASHCGIETTDALWITPSQALARAESGSLRIVYATRAHILRIAPHRSLDALVEFARSKPVRCVDPVINPDRSISLAPEVLDCW